MEILLKAHPKGLRRSEIAKRLGVHRSTAGRYISELSEVTMLWEDNFRVGINDRRIRPHISLSLPENFTILVAIQALMNHLDTPFPHLSTVLRKISLAMKERFPVSSEKMFILADKIGSLPDPLGLAMTDNLSNLSRHWKIKNFFI
jgi:CRISPR-associated endonuclease/helicase Cas3